MNCFKLNQEMISLKALEIKYSNLQKNKLILIYKRILFLFFFKKYKDTLKEEYIDLKLLKEFHILLSKNYNK